MTRKLRYLFTLLFVSIAGTAFAQGSSGSIQGKVLDENKEPMIGAIVQVLEGDVVKGGSATDEEGNYVVKPLAAGRYSVKVSSQSYKTKVISGVIVSSDKITGVNVNMALDAAQLNEVVVTAYEIPLIDPYAEGGRETRTSEQIEKMPARTTNAVVATTAGVYNDEQNGIQIQGARGDATLYIIDGIQVRGNAATNLPQNSIDQIDVISSGLSAKYGDAIGGVVNITTKGFSNKLRGNVLLERGVDGFGHNLANFTLSGPLYSKKTENGKKPIVGFFLGADGIYDEDGRPTYGGNYAVKEEKLKELQARPLVPVATQTGAPALRSASEFVRLDDLEIRKQRQSAENWTGRLNGKLDFQLAENLNLTAGGMYSYSNSRLYQFAWSLFSPEAMPVDKQSTVRGWLRLTQRFGKAPTTETEEGAKKPLISNAFYTLQADYQSTKFNREHPEHGKNIFNYNYIGKFNTEYATIFNPLGVDDSTGLTGVRLITDRQAVRTTFERSEMNPIASNYTTEFFRYIDPITINDVAAGGGLLNGRTPLTTYGVHTNIGHTFNGFVDQQRDQFAVSVDASFDLQPGKTRHAIEFGLYYQQRVERQYIGQPFVQNGLWTHMRLLANQHIQLDLANPILLVNGQRYTKEDWRNGTVAFSPFDTILYGYVSLDTAQSVFDRNLRTKLGLDPNGTDFINTEALDPSTYTLDMFSADELWNQGGNNNFVEYYGYDYTGKKQTGQVNFNDFFTKKDANGNFTRDIGAYRPNYIAGYILDKFQYKDMLFNIGVRIDRFDNNTKVLKDPYSLYEVNKLGAVRNTAENPLNGGVHPSNIGDDYVVYVTSNEAAKPNVVGYRLGDNWYDPFGRQIQDPASLRQYSNGRDPEPFLVNATTRIQDSTFDPNSSFTDYKPQVNVMPRVKFSFPISDLALFYAHYDMIVQRPRGVVPYATAADYYYMENNSTAIFPNSDLKPEKVIDYEVGFQQAVSKQSAIKLSGFYKERKDMIQVRPYLLAFPNTYYTYGNRDFSTTKGLKLEYDLRRLGNLRMNIAYTLQFAEGSGSGVSSANAGGGNFISNGGLLTSIIAAGIPDMRFTMPLDYDSRHMIVANVDYRYMDNQGPVISDVHFLQNAGLNFIFSARSGEPYTRYAQPLVVGRTVLGDLQGSRLPWHYMLDLKVDKDFKLNLRKKAAEGAQPRDPFTVNVYAMIFNVLNTRDVLSVNGYTGRPDDDGYLTHPNGIALAQNQSDPQAYVDLYRVSNMAPTRLNLPRRINIGLQFNF